MHPLGKLWPIPVLSHALSHAPITHPSHPGSPRYFLDHGTHQVLDPESRHNPWWTLLNLTELQHRTYSSPDPVFPNSNISCTEFLWPCTYYSCTHLDSQSHIHITLLHPTLAMCHLVFPPSHLSLSLTLEPIGAQILRFKSKTQSLFRGLNRDWVFALLGKCSQPMPCICSIRDPGQSYR